MMYSAEAMRRIVEQKPVFIVRWGNTFLLVAVVLLIALAVGMKLAMQ